MPASLLQRLQVLFLVVAVMGGSEMWSVGGQGLQGKLRVRISQVTQRPHGLYLPPPSAQGADETEEDIQPGGYTPKPAVEETEEDIQPGGFTPPPTTQPPRKSMGQTVIQDHNQIDGAGGKDEAAHAPGMPFAFEYGVKDAKSGNDYSHTSWSDGDVVRGSYSTLMADGRVQVVTYTADWKNGYRAIIRYV